jgi:hypothetical protein
MNQPAFWWQYLQTPIAFLFQAGFASERPECEVELLGQLPLQSHMPVIVCPGLVLHIIAECLFPK